MLESAILNQASQALRRFVLYRSCTFEPQLVEFNQTTPITALRANLGSVSMIRLSQTLVRTLVVLVTLCCVGCCFWRTPLEVTSVPIEECTIEDYPEDPSTHASQFGCYQGRSLTLVAGCDGRHFHFVFDSPDPRIAKIVFKNIDVSLLTPALPEHVRGDKGLERIALVDRQWNRQQVQFELPSPHVEVTGGDGFEVQHLAVASLAKNCLNAGLWEVLLVTKEEGKKALYYQGWFTFPLAHYQKIWEENTGLSYCQDCFWYRMEHWMDPSGTPIALDRLRTVCAESPVAASYNPCEAILYDGEQIRKTKTSNLSGMRTWCDVLHASQNSFATFVPPGRYQVKKPWGNEFWRLACYEKATVRLVQSPAEPGKSLHEIELVFRPDFSRRPDTKKFGKTKWAIHHDRMQGQPQAQTRIILGGVDLDSLSVLPTSNYSKGFYMPMGISVPPFYQPYEELTQSPPQYSPYYSFILDENDRWLDHHSIAVDGPVMHRDSENPDLVHLYLLSYERHVLVAHFVLPIARATTQNPEAPSAPQFQPELPPSLAK